MKYKTKPDVLRRLKENYEKACNSYLLELANMWELDVKAYGYWIGDKVGGAYDYGCGRFSIGMENIIYCVENNIPEKEYLEYTDYCTRIYFLWGDKKDFPNFKSWHEGCSRYSEKTLKELEEARMDFEKSLDEAKEEGF